MVTKGLTKKQLELGIEPRVTKLTKRREISLNIQHKSFEKSIPDDCYYESEPWIDYFETYYLAEYNSFSKPFRATRRILRFEAGKKIVYTYQIVYKTPSGRNAPSPVRDYLKSVNKKIDDAFGSQPKYISHLKEHLAYLVQEKHVKSLRAYVKARKEKGELK